MNVRAGGMTEDPNIIRDLIREENQMINHRMNWFLILQGLLFAAIAFAWEKGLALNIVFSCVGVLSSMSVGILLRFGITAIKDLEESVSGQGRMIGKGHKDVSSEMVRFLLPWNFLPFLFMIAWAALAVIRCGGVG